MNKQEPYQGFEQGPIRPPSEARSLLLRVTRNCPWNRCTFCPVYKQEQFSIRPVEHVKKDIDAIRRHFQTLQDPSNPESVPEQQVAVDIAADLPEEDLPAFQAAYHWLVQGGGQDVFLQDANSLVIKPGHLVEILHHLQQRFPAIRRVTSYARSASLVRLKPQDLAYFQAAGLNRIHVGLESGSDEVLARVQKGGTKEIHIRAGHLVKEAGMELSEYTMPGLGGRELSREHALETADALNAIAPDFIRLRSLAIPGGIPLADELDSGDFTKCNDQEVQQEILLFLENLADFPCQIRSDHILNLLPEVDGTWPADRDRLLVVVQEFLGLPAAEMRLFQVGRRLGLFTGMRDLADPGRRAIAEQAMHRLGITSGNCDQVLDDLVRRFV